MADLAPSRIFGQSAYLSIERRTRSGRTLKGEFCKKNEVWEHQPPFDSDRSSAILCISA